MSELDDLRADLEPGIEDEVVALAERLRRSRPVPRPAFRGELGRRLVARGGRHSIAKHARALIASYTLAGLVLLCAGTFSAAGLGPLG